MQGWERVINALSVQYPNCRIESVVACIPMVACLRPLVAASLVICAQHLHRANGAQEVLPCEGWGLTASQ